MKRVFYSPGTGESGGGAPAAKLIGEASAEQIAEWKKKYELGIYGYVANGRICYLRVPSFDELNFGFSKADKDKMTDMWKAFIEVTWLGGCEDFLTSAPHFSGLMRVVQQKVDGIKGELVNL